MSVQLQQLGSHKTIIYCGAGQLFFSYNTLVAAWVVGKGYLVTEKFYSRTTTKHVTQWLKGATATKVPQGALEALCTISYL